MAEIDPTKRKPRRTAGTPSYYYRNRFAAAVIAVGCSIFGVLYAIPIFREANKKFIEEYSKPNIELQERKALFGLTPARRGEEILKLLKESEDIEKER